MFKYSKNESLIHQTITKTNIQTCNKLTFECSKKNKHSNVQPTQDYFSYFSDFRPDVSYAQALSRSLVRASLSLRP